MDRPIGFPKFPEGPGTATWLPGEMSIGVDEVASPSTNKGMRGAWDGHCMYCRIHGEHISMFGHICPYERRCVGRQCLLHHKTLATNRRRRAEKNKNIRLLVSANNELKEIEMMLPLAVDCVNSTAFIRNLALLIGNPQRSLEHSSEEASKKINDPEVANKKESEELMQLEPSLDCLIPEEILKEFLQNTMDIEMTSRNAVSKENTWDVTCDSGEENIAKDPANEKNEHETYCGQPSAPIARTLADILTPNNHQNVLNKRPPQAHSSVRFSENDSPHKIHQTGDKEEDMDLQPSSYGCPSIPAERPVEDMTHSPIDGRTSSANITDKENTVNPMNATRNSQEEDFATTPENKWNDSPHKIHQTGDKEEDMDLQPSSYGCPSIPAERPVEDMTHSPIDGRTSSANITDKENTVNPMNATRNSQEEDFATTPENKWAAAFAELDKIRDRFGIQVIYACADEFMNAKISKDGETTMCDRDSSIATEETKQNIPIIEGLDSITEVRENRKRKISEDESDVEILYVGPRILPFNPKPKKARTQTSREQTLLSNSSSFIGVQTIHSPGQKFLNQNPAVMQHAPSRQTPAMVPPPLNPPANTIPSFRGGNSFLSNENISRQFGSHPFGPTYTPNYQNMTMPSGMQNFACHPYDFNPFPQRL